MTYEERVQLNTLSKLVYGKTSKWNTLLKKGEEANIEETLEDGTIRKYRGVRYLSVDEVKVKMQKLWQDELDRQEAVNAAKGLSDLEKEAIAQREMVKEKAGSNVGA